MSKAGRVGALALWAVMASAHLCNNIYKTPDRLIVKPEKQVVNLDQVDEFRVFAQNNFPTVVNKLRLSATVDGDGVDVTVTPASFDQLKPGERVSESVSFDGAAERGAPIRAMLSQAGGAVLRGQVPLGL